jgi:pimeloyl-ACP methyl ester carboxylesterase
MEVQGVKYWTYHDTGLPTAIFIHGFTGSHEGFQYIIPELKDFHIIVPDLPGFGQSRLSIDDYTIEALARKVNEFVQALDLPTPPMLVSHSMGGLVAASMLAQSPDLFAKKTVFISPVATRVQYLDARKLGELLGRVQYFLGKTVPGAGPRLVKSRLISRLATELLLTKSETELKRRIRQHHYDNLNYISSIDFYHKLHKDINRRGAIDQREALKKFDVLAIAGDKDNVTPLRTVRQFAGAVNASLRIIPEAGHLAHYEQPQEIAAGLREFLR